MWVIQSEVDPVRYFWVPHFGDAYVVGDDGSVWSRYKRIGLGYGGGFDWYISDDWTRLNPLPDKGGYFNVHLRFNGKTYPKAIHRLVCEAVHGPCPPGMEVCHNDNNPSHNDYWNLRHDTLVNNNSDKIIHRTFLNGEKCNWAKHTWGEIREIREKFAGGCSLQSLELEYGMSRRNVLRIIKNLTWKEEKNVQ